MSYPIQTMLHEMLHTYGMADEYHYSESEAEAYCRRPQTQSNIAHFTDRPPYSSDLDARQRHEVMVPWMGRINRGDLITQGRSLGSPMMNAIPRGQQVLGLYRGGTCDNAEIQSWRPYPNSIMRGYDDDTIYPLYEDVIRQSIESQIGRRVQLAGTNITPPPPPAAVECQVDPLNGNPNIQDFRAIMKHTSN